MQPVLIIAHHFPPMGGPGTQRTVQLVKRLPALGYKPIVITISDEDVKAGAYPADESLLQQLPPEVEIHRIATGEPRAFKKRMMQLRLFRICWFVFYRRFWETAARWPDQVIPYATQLAKEKNISIVYTTSGPFSPFFIGKALQEQGLKWVADLRDPYSDSYSWQWPSRWHWNMSRRVEQKLLALPDKLIVNTPEVKKLYSKRGWVNEHKMEVITNGY